MSSALVLGDRGSGLTTFVGLLYTAQVRLGIDEADEFRFHADRESIRRLEAIYGELGSGRFPTHDPDLEEHPLSFVFGFRHGRLRSLGAASGASDPGFDAVEVLVGGLPIDEAAELHAHDARLDRGTRELLRSRVVIPLVDAVALSPDPNDAERLSLARADRLLASTFGLLEKFVAAERERRSRRLFPLFVVTKVDRLHLETLRRLDAPSGVPAEWKPEARRAFGERLLRQYYPDTATALDETHRTDGLTIARPEWFYSGLATEVVADELRVQRRSRAPVGGWEPSYPFEEYRSLIETLGKLARRLPAVEAS
jgi:hypothetical protein